MAHQERSRSPRRDRQASPRKGNDPVRAKNGTLNVISGGFTTGIEIGTAREVYASQISGTPLAGKRPREEGEVSMFFSEAEMKRVTCPHGNALVNSAEIDGYDVKRVLIDADSSTDVLFLDALKKMGRSEKNLKKVNFPLMGFASNTTYLVGIITLPVYIGEG